MEEVILPKTLNISDIRAGVEKHQATWSFLLEGNMRGDDRV